MRKIQRVFQFNIKFSYIHRYNTHEYFLQTGLLMKIIKAYTSLRIRAATNTV